MRHKLNIPDVLPVLMLRDIVVFPYMVVPLFVGREKSKNAIDHSLSSHRMIFLLTQKDMEIEDPKVEDVYEYGTVALVMRMLKLPDGTGQDIGTRSWSGPSWKSFTRTSLIFLRK